MSQKTIYLAKLFGLFLLILGISMLVQREETIFLWIALVLPRDLAMDTFTALAYDQYFYVYVLICLVLGAYLTIAGFRAGPERAR